jgi:hypothetical protein
MTLTPKSARCVSMDEGHFSLSETLHLSCICFLASDGGMKMKFERV